MDVADRVPQLGGHAIYLKQLMRDKRVEHKQYITQYGQDLPEICDWKWSY
jgi:xylulose-5-phosphate/fructose-6-phosphate phosphoketolase